MDDSILFSVILWGLAAYTIVCVVQFLLWLSREQSTWHPFGCDSDPMECPDCKEISLRPYGVVTPRNGRRFVEYECDECGCYLTV